jgi:aryl-alcohol dehydrogenase-like predicted oxidoreductase
LSNKLILGTVQFGLNYGINNSLGKIAEDEAYKIVQASLEKNVNIFDTAANYGDSEEILGRCINQIPNREINIITKLDSKLNIEDSLFQSLERLRLRKVKYLMFHSFDQYLKNKAILKEFNKKHRNIHFDSLGVSIYTNNEIELLLLDKNIDLIQVPFNLLDNEYQRGNILKKAKENDKIIHVRSIFLQGLFYKQLESIQGKLSNLKNDLKKLNEIAEINNIDLNKMAMSYVLSKSYIDGVLFGVDNLKQLEENISASEHKLDNHIIKLIDNIKVIDIDLLNPSNWN